jgi:hypothetical protein
LKEFNNGFHNLFLNSYEIKKKLEEEEEEAKFN